MNDIRQLGAQWTVILLIMAAVSFAVLPSALAQQQNQQGGNSVDMMFIVDESGSMEGEHDFIGNQVQSINQRLNQRGITNNRYGLVGYEETGRELTVGSGKMGSAQELSQAAQNLILTGGTEDGYNAIDFALQNYSFRSDAAVAFVLVTDEDRDEVNQTLTTSSIFNVLNNRNISLTGMLDQEIFASDGTTRALVINPQNEVFLADGSGGVTKEPNGSLGDGDGTTTEDYAELSLDLDSCVADLNKLREGGDVADSFSEAFLECLALIIERQEDCVTLIEVARTPRQRAVARVLLDQRGEENGLSEVVTAINSVCNDDMRRAALDEVSGISIPLLASSMFARLHTQSFHIDSRLDALHRGGAAMARAGSGQFNLDSEPIQLADASDSAGADSSLAGSSYGSAIPGQSLRSRTESKTRWGFFSYGSYSDIEYDHTANQLPGDTDLAEGVFGADYWVRPDLSVGAAVSLSGDDLALDNGTDMDTNTASLAAYGTHFITPSLWLDGMVSYGDAEIEMERAINLPGMRRVAYSEPDASIFSTKWRLVKEFTAGNWHFGPEAAVRYADVNIDSYTETGAGALNLDVDSQDARSLTGEAGGYLSYDLQVAGRPVVPYLSSSWVHEFKDNNRHIRASFADVGGTRFSVPNDEPDADYVSVSVGATVLLNENLNVYADYTSLFGHSQLDSDTVRLGLRAAF